MAALNFPDHNLVTSYTNPDTGITYEWTNNSWKAVRTSQVSSGSGSQTLVSDTMPSPDGYEVGTLWWNSDSTDTSLYVLYQDPVGPNGDVGGKYWIEAAPAPDSIGFNGTHTGDSTFTGNMNVTGNGTFAGDVEVKMPSSGWWGDGGIVLGNSGYLYISQDTSTVTRQLFKLNNPSFGGDVVIFQADGSATFAGETNIGGYNGSSNTTDGVLLGSVGGVYTQLAAATAGSGVVFQGMHGSSFTSRITADGSATFGNSPVAFSFTSGYSGGLDLSKDGYSKFAVDTTGNLTSNGSATFAAAVNVGSLDYTSNSGVGSEIRNDGLIRVQRASGSASAVYQAWRGNLNTLNISADGSATFADYVTSSEGFYVEQTAAPSGSSIFKSWLAGSTYVDILDNGSATFAGEVVAGVRDSQGVFMTPGGALEGFNGGSRKYSLSSNGSASFGNFNNLSNTTIGVTIDQYNDSHSGVRTQCTSAATTVGEFFAGYRGTSVVFQVTTGGNATFAGTINGTTVGTSDIKFKENIEAAPAQLADIEAFELKTFDWKDEAPMSDELKAQRKIGLIAQEVEAICPEMVCEVAGQDDDSYKAINHDVLIMKLLGAVKELSAKVAALEAN